MALGGLGVLRFILHRRGQRQIISQGLSPEHKQGEQFILFDMWHLGMRRAKEEPGGGEEGAGRALPTGGKKAVC